MVGQGFSVHHTRVIAGGREIPYKLISREIMEVTVPPGVQPLGQSIGLHENSVDFHVSTPYGVSSHLLVPVVAATPGIRTPTWNPGAIQFEMVLKAPEAEGGSFTVERIGVNPPSVLGVETPLNSLGSSGQISLNLFASTEAGFVRVGTSAVTLATSFDRSNSRYIVQPYGLSALLTQVRDYVLAEANAKRIASNSTRIAIAAQGTLQVPTSGVAHEVAGALPIEVKLTWE